MIKTFSSIFLINKLYKNGGLKILESKPWSNIYLDFVSFLELPPFRRNPQVLYILQSKNFFRYFGVNK